MSSLAERIKSRRLELGLSQEQVAERAGVSQGIIWKLENDKATSSRKIHQLARALECDTDWLADGSGNPPADVSEPGLDYLDEPRFSRAPRSQEPTHPQPAPTRPATDIALALYEFLGQSGLSGSFVKLILAAKLGRLTTDDRAQIKHLADKTDIQKS